MEFSEICEKLLGDWEGQYQLWLDPDAPPDTSKSKARITKTVKDKFLQIEYDWSYEGEKNEGLLVIGYNEIKEKIQMSWIDSWHQQHDFMHSTGLIENENTFSAKGSYLAPKGPNWEWRTRIIAQSDNAFTFEMYNISPLGNEDIAVRVEYSKK